MVLWRGFLRPGGLGCLPFKEKGGPAGYPPTEKLQYWTQFVSKLQNKSIQLDVFSTIEWAFLMIKILVRWFAMPSAAVSIGGVQQFCCPVYMNGFMFGGVYCCDY